MSAPELIPGRRYNLIHDWIGPIKVQVVYYYDQDRKPRLRKVKLLEDSNVFEVPDTGEPHIYRAGETIMIVRSEVKIV